MLKKSFADSDIFNLMLLFLEHCVLCHEGYGQSVPPETIVHIIEDTLDFILRFLAMA